jgi:hypothetical protein
MKPQEKYILLGKHVIPVYELKNGQLITEGDIFNPNEVNVYTNRFDAMYDKLIKDLQCGKSIESYKSSKYYKQYIERLKKDNPEYVL